jgi:class 3 adenylate cyclase
MAEAARAAITPILFTDLVDSTALMQRVGDERAQRLFETHHRLLSDAVSAHGGSELRWLGVASWWPSPRQPMLCAARL